ncbi:hypothetical protein P0136_04305 [Lentisphaerota bacterium ZTH]|nr:hypothetical protein P0136_04305 [Lentisphaerota bacterium ZTH]
MIFPPKPHRQVFGKRNARIIGKRFKLVHLRYSGDLIEISTFRRTPDETGQIPGKQRKSPIPENMIFRDNDYGTAEEDAWRRDFTVNALFYDPVHDDLIDFTGFGIGDMHEGIVRAIGDPLLRFEEDPVRILRALKLVGQYNFIPDPETQKAIKSSIPLIMHAANSRLSLELEKILKGTYGHNIFIAFHDYGFLGSFLPFLETHWNTPPCSYALELLAGRNDRVQRGIYRDSISLAMAALTLPFIEAEIGKGHRGELWTSSKESKYKIRRLVLEVFKPHNMIKRLTSSAQRILSIQPKLRFTEARSKSVTSLQGYTHSRELMMLQNELVWQDENLSRRWPKFVSQRKRKKKRSGKKHRKHAVKH